MLRPPLGSFQDLGVNAWFLKAPWARAGWAPWARAGWVLTDPPLKPPHRSRQSPVAKKTHIDTCQASRTPPAVCRFVVAPTHRQRAVGEAAHAFVSCCATG